MTIKDLIARLEHEYGGSAFTGPWAGNSIREQAISEAISILEDAFERSTDQDMRTDEIKDALDFLEGEGGKPWPMQSYRKALEIPNQRARWQNLNAALNGICREFGRPRR